MLPGFAFKIRNDDTPTHGFGIDNRHFLSDVIFGAALGEAVGWTVVGRHGRSRYALQPVPVPGGMMIALVRTAD